MKKIKVVKSSDIETEPFVLDVLALQNQTQNRLRSVSKKELKSLAKKLKLKYDDENIKFASKLINAYIKKSL